MAPPLAGNSTVPSNSPQVLWGGIAHAEQIVHFYEDDHVLLDTLAGFVAGGIRGDECSIIIATPEHRAALEKRLTNFEVDVWRAQLENRYIALDAETTLARFMVNRLPDQKLFIDCVEGLLRQATSNCCQVRAFGEMVALLWTRGESVAAVRLDSLWRDFCQSHTFSLLCGYPKAGFAEEPDEAGAPICAAQPKVF